jgi:hypothetical protein
LAEATKTAALRKSSARRIGFIRFDASLSLPAKGGKKAEVYWMPPKPS